MVKRSRRCYGACPRGVRRTPKSRTSSGLRDAAGAPAAAVAVDGPDSDDEVEGDDVYAAQLEAELSSTEMAQSFDRPTDDAPVDVDFNLVKNLLESVEAQDGAAPGAAALLLNELGLELPADD